ncbi:MAG TPA: Ku protein [Mycobacteriales bacterium]
MRAIWKGAVSFGLITIPVRVFRATEERDVSFHQVRRSDGSRIKYKRVAAADGEEVSYADIAKGYELPGGETVILTDDDLADLPLTTSRAIEVDAFVPLEQVDPIYFERSYYLEPEGGQALKPYALLRDALEQSGRVAIVKVALRRREQLATLRVRDGVFVLETMLWPDEIRPPEFAFLDEDVSVRPQELSMAQSLIESLAGDFDPTQYTDAYREAVEAVVASKIEGREVVSPPEADTEQGAEVLDLMAALRASVAAAKKARGAEAEKAEPTKAPAKKAPAKKAPAKKAAAKKAAPKRSAATKTQAKKAPAKKAPAKRTSARKKSA